jgi:hypothetical protein
MKLYESDEEKIEFLRGSFKFINFYVSDIDPTELLRDSFKIIDSIEFLRDKF